MLCLAIGVWHAMSLRFMTDDAFISFRYAKNLVNGLGLVFNAGEHVEGFTNFLWTMLVALGMRSGFDPVAFSTAAGIVFYLGTLALCALLSFRLYGNKAHAAVLLPLTTIALSLHHDVNAYATGGLETAMFMFLVSAAAATLLLTVSGRGTFAAGTLFVLLMMTRPDGIVFLIAALGYLFLTQPRWLQRCALLMAPSALFFLPYWLWRFGYYGYFFPNSFYAKSIDLPYYSQGLEYTFLFFKTYYIFGLILILGAVLAWRLRSAARDTPVFALVKPALRPRDGKPHPLLLGLLLAGTYTLFIIRIGGDFMFARFFVPITPLLYLAMEHLIHLTANYPQRAALVAAVILGTWFRADQFRDAPVLGFIADENRYYSEKNLTRSMEDGALLRKYFDHLPVTVAFWAGQVKLIYYADPAAAIETTTGLTDAYIAHQPLRSRGRPGHEKNAPLSYLMKRKVNFYLSPSEAPPRGALPLNAIVFDKILARIIVYDNAVMSQLSRYPEVAFVRLPEYLDSQIAAFGSRSREELNGEFSFLDAFYFRPNNDTLRRNAFLRYLEPSAPPQDRP
jgi:hypothetical protein